MPDLVVVIPSRGRPFQAAVMAEEAQETCTADTRFVYAVDWSDPERDSYKRLIIRPHLASFAGLISQPDVPGANMVTALNYAAKHVTEWSDAPVAVGFMGDDHAPRTKGWDQAYLDALREFGTGIVYGDDLLQGEKLPTQVAMTSDIVRALGYMAPPTLTHMYVDNFWLDLGRQADCLRYLPDVVVEHMHPIANKADWDDGHKRVNAPAMYNADRVAYMRYTVEQLRADVATVRGLR